jgi:hypothetical protein
MRLHLSLLSIVVCACTPKANGASSNVPSDDESEFASDPSGDADDDDADGETSGPITVTLHNLCDKPQQWVVIDGDVTPDPSAGQEIAPAATTQIELEDDHWVARKDAEGQWSGRARAQADGGHVWMSSSCEGISASDDPDADPAALDAQMRETMRRASGG